jgi:MFS family permease
LNPLYVLVALTTLGHTVQVGSRLAVMLYAVHFNASPATVGVIAALYNIVAVFTSVHVGRWIDRSGSRLPMLVGAAMITVGSAIGFVWRDLPALVFVALLIGSFHNFTFIAQQRLSGQYGGPADRVKNFAWTSLAQSLAGVLGPLLAGFFIDHAGFPETFMMFTVLGALAFAVLALGLLEYPPHEPPKPRAGPRHGTLTLLKNDRELRRIYYIAVLASSTWSIVIFLIPLYGTQIGLDASTIGLIIGAFSFATVLTRLILPWLTRSMTHWQIMVASLVFCGLGFIAVPGFKAVWILSLLSAWIGFGLGLTGPISQAILYDVSPPDRIGELLGLRVTMLNASHAFMPILSGSIGAAVGVAPVFWLVAGFLFWGGFAIRDEWHRPRTRGSATQET